MCSACSSRARAPRRRGPAPASSAAPARWRRASRRYRPRRLQAPSRTHRGHGRVVGLAAANPHDLLDVEHEDLAVADLAGPAAVAQRLDRRLDEVVGDRDLEPHLLRQPDADGRAAVGLDAVELTAVTLHAAHREPSDLGAVQRLEHLVGLLGTDDPDHQLHAHAPAWTTTFLSAREPLRSAPGRLWPPG